MSSSLVEAARHRAVFVEAIAYSRRGCVAATQGLSSSIVAFSPGNNLLRPARNMVALQPRRWLVPSTDGDSSPRYESE